MSRPICVFASLFNLDTDRFTFRIMFAPFCFFTFAVGVPLIIVVLRTVDYAERAFALGIQWILVRIIGTIPAPVLFGWLFDVSCVRQHFDPCLGEGGSCMLYQNKLLADLFLAFSVAGQVRKKTSQMFLQSHKFSWSPLFVLSACLYSSPPPFEMIPFQGLQQLMTPSIELWMGKRTLRPCSRGNGLQVFFD